MDDEMRILNEAMVVKERLRVLAELQAAYWEELTTRGLEASISEQLVLEWSRHAYSMTFRALPEPTVDTELQRILGGLDALPDFGAQPPAPASGDPSSVPPGEPWLQLVQDADVDDASASSDDDAADDRAA